MDRKIFCIIHYFDSASINIHVHVHISKTLSVLNSLHVIIEKYSNALCFVHDYSFGMYTLQ